MFENCVDKAALGFDAAMRIINDEREWRPEHPLFTYYCVRCRGNHLTHKERSPGQDPYERPPAWKETRLAWSSDWK